jgi:ribonuclease BN (tRNA processing enzyme)
MPLHEHGFFCILENPNIKENPAFEHLNMDFAPRLKIYVFILGLFAPAISMANQCPPADGVAVQVLGSGGPIADDGRSSSAYLVWVDGKSRVLIDAGGGTFLRFAEAKADFRDLEFIGLSHFHADHSADFPALLKSGSFSGRSEPLTVAGPDGSDLFPGLNRFLTGLIDPDSGAFAYLGPYLTGNGRLPMLNTIEVDSEDTEPHTVFGNNDSPIQIEAMHVPHGIVPAIAFRVRIGAEVVVFASDQNGGKPEFVKFARDASLLVMHMPVPEGVTGVGRKLHAPPSVIGTIANDADVKMLVISHLMERSLRDLPQNVDLVKSKFGGPVDVADDLRCYKF